MNLSGRKGKPNLNHVPLKQQQQQKQRGSRYAGMTLGSEIIPFALSDFVSYFHVFTYTINY